MACNACAAARQYAYNLALAADLALNSLLGGDPHESVSARTARARAAGSRSAAAFCAVLTWIGSAVFRANRDHCTWALGPQAPDADEVWHWCPPK